MTGKRRNKRKARRLAGTDIEIDSPVFGFILKLTAIREVHGEGIALALPLFIKKVMDMLIESAQNDPPIDPGNPEPNFAAAMQAIYEELPETARPVPSWSMLELASMMFPDQIKPEHYQHTGSAH